MSPLSSAITLNPIGVVRNSVREPADDIWGGLISRIDLDSTRFSPESLTGLDQFSHVDIVFFLDRIRDSDILTGLRHPRGRTDWPRVGIFAQRTKNRPNRLGVTTCRLVSVEGVSVSVEGLDAIDGTRVLDIKPYMSGFAPKGDVREPEWSRELMTAYWNVKT